MRGAGRDEDKENRGLRIQSRGGKIVWGRIKKSRRWKRRCKKRRRGGRREKRGGKKRNIEGGGNPNSLLVYNEIYEIEITVVFHSPSLQV